MSGIKNSVSMSGLKETVEGELFKTPFFNPPQVFLEIEVDDPLAQDQLKQQLDLRPLESEMVAKKKGTLSKLTGRKNRSVSDLPRPSWDIFSVPGPATQAPALPAEAHQEGGEQQDHLQQQQQQSPGSISPSETMESFSEGVPIDISVLSLAASAPIVEQQDSPVSSPFGEFSFAEGMGTLKKLTYRTLRKKGLKATLNHDAETSKYASVLTEQRAPETIVSKMDHGRRLVMEGSPEHLLKLLGMQTELQADFVDVFLCTFRAFATPTEVLESLITSHREYCIDITNEETQMMDKGTVIDWNESVEKHIIGVLMKWYTYHYLDFAEDMELDLKFRDFLRSDIFEVSTRVNIPNLIEKLDKVKEAHEKWLVDTKLMVHYREAVEKNGAAVMRKTSTKSIFDLNLTAAAKALCQLEMDILRQIPSWEFCSNAWTGKNCEQAAPMLFEHIYLFNKISNWVATEIVMTPNIDMRANLIERFIAMARQAREWNNFNSSFQIVLGLHNPAVLKLKSTWAKVGRKYVQALKEVNDLVNPEKNHRSYRMVLSKTSPPCVPYVGMYLKDLVFASDGSKTVLPNGNINFGKLNTIGMTILAIRRFQTLPYPFEDDTLIHWFRHHTFAMSDDELLAASKKLLLESSEV